MTWGILVGCACVLAFVAALALTFGLTWVAGEHDVQDLEDWQ